MPNQQLPHNMHNYVSTIFSILREHEQHVHVQTVTTILLQVTTTATTTPCLKKLWQLIFGSCLSNNEPISIKIG